ncbi:MAG: DNA-3-methyladenine glycosylase [Planctomycetaceae bacterium]
MPLMQNRRRTETLRDLCRGPARLTEAFAIDRGLNGWNLTKTNRLWIAEGGSSAKTVILSSPRIGVTSAHDLPLRFFVEGSAFVSGTRRLNEAGLAGSHID